MKHLLYVILSTLLCLAPSAGAQNTAANRQMPVIAYLGPAVESVSLREYQDMKQCGFTHSINIYNTLESAVRDMATAQKAGMKIFVHTPQVVTTPKAAALKLKSSEALAGYFICDEPNMNTLQKWGNTIKQIQAVDTQHPCYVNLHPYYSPSQLKLIGATSYKRYLQTAARLGTPQISFDFYPVTTKGIRDTWHKNLSDIRQESLLTGKPFWGYVLTVPHNDYPQPTIGMLRLQAYTNLAYGAQALQFFTYRTPADKNYNFRNAPIGRDGRKTTTYNIVKQLTSEMRHITGLFYGCKIQTIGHLLHIPAGEKKLAQLPPNIKHLSVKGTAGAVVSIFTKGGTTYMAIVNKDYKSDMTLRIDGEKDIVRHIDKKLKENIINNNYTVRPGDIELFKLK